MVCKCINRHGAGHSKTEVIAYNPHLNSFPKKERAVAIKVLSIKGTPKETAGSSELSEKLMDADS